MVSTPPTICCLALGLGENVGRQDKPVPSSHGEEGGM